MEPNELQKEIKALSATVQQIGVVRVDFRELWDTVKTIQASFNRTEFTDRKQRQHIWDEFQDVVSNLKASRDKTNVDREKRFGESERVRDRIFRKAQHARPSTDFENAIFDLFTLGVRHVVTAAVNMLPGPDLDERKMELESCSKSLGEGWAMLKEEKGSMIRLHKDEAFNELMDAKDRLDAAWESWKGVKQKMWEAKRAAHEERQAEYERKKSDFIERVQANIDKNEEKLQRAENGLQRAEENLQNLYEKLGEARSDGYRERVESWISETEDRISSIRSSIDRLEGWIREDRNKL